MKGVAPITRGFFDGEHRNSLVGRRSASELAADGTSGTSRTAGAAASRTWAGEPRGALHGGRSAGAMPDGRGDRGPRASNRLLRGAGRRARTTARRSTPKRISTVESVSSSLVRADRMPGKYHPSHTVVDTDRAVRKRRQGAPPCRDQPTRRRATPLRCRTGVRHSSYARWAEKVNEIFSRKRRARGRYQRKSNRRGHVRL